MDQSKLVHSLSGCVLPVEVPAFAVPYVEEQVREAGWILENYTYDLHHHEIMNAGNVMTEYEEKFSAKGNPINKLVAVRK